MGVKDGGAPRPRAPPEMNRADGDDEMTKIDRHALRGLAVGVAMATAGTLAGCAAVNPCRGNPCGGAKTTLTANPCAASPCAAKAANPCKANPCAAAAADNPCAANPCAAKAENPCAANPCAAEKNPCAASL